MSRIHPAWTRATSLADLGRLTADWLEGRLGGECPGYCDTTTDPETKHLIPTLARVNRTGFVTSNSQPGEKHPQQRQRAAVDGYINDPHLFRRITDEAVRANLTVVVERPGDHNRGFVVTQQKRRIGGWRDLTWFGLSVPRQERVEVDWHETGRGAVHEAGQAICLTLIDDTWGRDDRLWKALVKATR